MATYIWIGGSGMDIRTKTKVSTISCILSLFTIVFPCDERIINLYVFYSIFYFVHDQYSINLDS